MKEEHRSSKHLNFRGNLIAAPGRFQMTDEPFVWRTTSTGRAFVIEESLKKQRVVYLLLKHVLSKSERKTLLDEFLRDPFEKWPLSQVATALLQRIAADTSSVETFLREYTVQIDSGKIRPNEARAHGSGFRAVPVFVVAKALYDFGVPLKPKFQERFDSLDEQVSTEAVMNRDDSVPGRFQPYCDRCAEFFPLNAIASDFLEILVTDRRHHNVFLPQRDDKRPGDNVHEECLENLLLHLQTAIDAKEIPGERGPSGYRVRPIDFVPYLARAYQIECGWLWMKALVDFFEERAQSAGPDSGSKAQHVPGDVRDPAKELCASSWGDVRLVVRDNGLTFHCGGKHKSVDWAALEIPEYLQTLLKQIALHGGTLDATALHGEAGGNHFERTAARESANSTRRDYVRRLNVRLRAQFPSLRDNPLYNEEGVIKTRFKDIEDRV
ncbi:MAG: hypothetical protein ACLFTT_09345 [Candidatus Hydrogenedentota bacterium]